LRDASPLQQKLKALTIANELMYSPEAVAAFRAANGCREALAVLRTTRTSPTPTQAEESGQTDTTVEENIRMFAAEVERIVFVEGGTLATRTRRFFPPMRKSGFGSSSPFGDLKGKAEKTLEKRLKTPDMQFAVQRAFSGMVEKTAATTTSAMRKVMQEAQGLLDTGEKASPPVSPRRLGKHSPINRGFPSPKGNENMCPSGEQDEAWQLQWALSASLAESQKLHEPSAAEAEHIVESSSPRSQAETGRGSDVDSLREPAGDDSQSLPQCSEVEAAALRMQLLESQAHANDLAEQLARATQELEWANARLREAEKSLATEHPGRDDEVYESVVQQLLDRIAVLEAMCGATGPC